jgi:hypothetical protein
MNSHLDHPYSELISVKAENSICQRLYFYGAYLITLFVFGFAFNAALLGKYALQKSLRTPNNLFLMALVFTNFLTVLTYLPIQIVSYLSCG